MRDLSPFSNQFSSRLGESAWPGMFHLQQQVAVSVWQMPGAVMCSFELLMMDGKPVWNMYSVLQK